MRRDMQCVRLHSDEICHNAKNLNATTSDELLIYEYIDIKFISQTSMLLMSFV